MRNRIMLGVLLLLVVAVISTHVSSDTVKISLPVSSWSYVEDGEGALIETSSENSEDSSNWEFKAQSEGEVVLRFVDVNDSSNFMTYYYNIDHKNHVTGTRVVGTVELS